MVDVSTKDNTKRTAMACCIVVLGKRVFDLVLANQMGKEMFLEWRKSLALTEQNRPAA
ncbi:unnamed protein product [Arabis nemorensis]|uniref:Molybdopterin cofactor biosynthesis C (MoaC) domain-containing protein n=1 Tax=Arabis nemorensis TaxID=586526 RepID=A0A565B1K7_9BRAS|nr:unnamed protein product [Arabis nemorensis]